MPIPGTKRVKYLEENVAAAAVVLDAAADGALDDALAPEQGLRAALQPDGHVHGGPLNDESGH